MAKYKIEFLQSAIDDLEEIVLYIAKDSPKSAMEFHDKVIESALRLEEFPNLGRLVPDKKLKESGFRLIVIGKYLLFYKIYGEEINILRVLRGDRNYPVLFSKITKNSYEVSEK